MAAAAVFVLSSNAGAASMAVNYDVADKPLKAAVSGTMLTFGLYSDADCTQLVEDQQIAIDDVKIARLKLFTPAGGTKATKTDTIHAVMTGADLVQGAFLKVTGTGITPVGGACQAQPGQTAGKIVSVSQFGGSYVGSVGLGGPAFQFLGAYAIVSTTEDQTIVATAQLPIRATDGVTLTYDLCYEPFFFGDGPIGASGTGASTIVGDSGLARSVTVAGTVTPGPGTWQVGPCVKSGSGGFAATNQANGFVMVTQN